MLRQVCLYFALLISYNSFSQTIINAYAKVTSVSVSTLNLSNVNETHDTFIADEQVIIMQMQDDIIGANTRNNANFGNIEDIESAGYYEVATISSYTPGSNILVLSTSLVHTYNTGTNSSVQIISYPQYENYTTTDDLTAVAWDGNIGGVLAIQVTNTLTLSNNISVDNLGFRGGIANPTGSGSSCSSTTYRTGSDSHARKGEGIYNSTRGQYEAGRASIANGGGGGSFHNGGGAGGGNFTSGGNGGPGWDGSANGCNPSGGGLGGADLSAYISSDRIFMGGGGGGGQQNNNVSPTGGSGGGIMLIKANTVLTAGGCGGITISANGQTTSNSGNDGGSGSGAGGSILFEVLNWDLSCQLDVAATGGTGGSVNSGAAHGGGGGGGRGTILFSGVAPVSNFSTNNTEGSGGTNSSNGTGGSAPDGDSTPSSPDADPDGIVETIDSPLPVELLFWKAKSTDYGVELKWATATEINNDYFEIESSMNGIDWESIAIIQGHGSCSDRKDYFYLARYNQSATIYYRLSQTDYDGQFEVFNPIMVTSDSQKTNVLLMPNPNDGHFAVQLNNLIDESLVNVQILDLKGQSVNYRSSKINGRIEFDLSEQQKGIYLLKIICAEEVQIMRIEIQ